MTKDEVKAHWKSVLGFTSDDGFKDSKYFPTYPILTYKGKEIRMSNSYSIDILNNCGEDDLWKLWHFYDEVIDEYLDKKGFDYSRASIIISQIVDYGIPDGYMPCGQGIYNAKDVVYIYDSIATIEYGHWAI